MRYRMKVDIWGENYYVFQLYIQKSIFGLKYWSHLHRVSARTVDAWDIDQLLESYNMYLECLENLENKSKKFPIVVEKTL